MLYDEGKTDQQIADYMQLDRAGVTRLRNQMGLIPTWGKTEQKFTTTEERAILCLRDDWDFGWAEIARGMGLDVTEARTISDRYHAIHEEIEQARTEAAPSVEKKCLRCRKPFTTTDPKKEWYCTTHRESAARYGSFVDECRLAI